MKKIKIGKQTVNICSTLDDISYMRATMFKQYIAKILYSTDLPIFQEAMEKYKEAVNKGLHSEGLIIWRNFEQSQMLQEKSFDAYGICFALIAIEDKEYQSVLNEEYLKEKLKKWDKAGLKRSTVEKEVENFTSAFPNLYIMLKSKSEGLNLTGII